jgi:hypothetical protein
MRFAQHNPKQTRVAHDNCAWIPAYPPPRAYAFYEHARAAVHIKTTFPSSHSPMRGSRLGSFVRVLRRAGVTLPVCTHHCLADPSNNNKH